MWHDYAPFCSYLKPLNLVLGEILLDDELSGQLYVKNVWVQDMIPEDLKTGVNFTSLRIDR